MTKKITRPLCLLLDCNVVIKAYELGIWPLLAQKGQLLVPGTVVEEALYYFDSNGNKSPSTCVPRLMTDQSLKSTPIWKIYLSSIKYLPPGLSKPYTLEKPKH